MAERFPFNVQAGQFGAELLLAERHAGADFVQGRRQGFHLGAGCGQCGFLPLRAFQADELFVFQTLGLARFKPDLMLDGFSLLGSFHGVQLGAEARRLLAVAGDLALQASAQRFLAAQRIRAFGGLAFGPSQRSLGLGDFGRKGAHRNGQPCTFHIHALQLDEIFNVRLHPCYGVYAMHRLLRK